MAGVVEEAGAVGTADVEASAEATAAAGRAAASHRAAAVTSLLVGAAGSRRTVAAVREVERGRCR